MVYSASPSFLNRQRNLFWILASGFALGSILILRLLHGYFLESFFQVMVVVQITWGIAFLLVMRKMIFAWHGLRLQTMDNELLIEKGEQKLHVPYSSIAKLFVRTKNQQILNLKIETSASPKLITLQVSYAHALYETLKTKIENPWKIAIEKFEPLSGFYRVLVSLLPGLIVLVVLFRAFMAFEAIGMRPDLGISYENWLILAIFELGAAIALAVQVFNRKRIAYVFALVIGLIFLFGILNTILTMRFGEAPLWYEMTFFVYAGVLFLGNLISAFLLIKKPPAAFSVQDLGNEVESFR